MTAQSVEGLGSTRMSSNLLATLGRANDYARAQNHTKVTLEHVLLALSEDPDALVLLQTTNVNVDALKADVSGHISRNEDRHAEGAPSELTISSEVGDIMKAASAAAQGRRPEIDGAIVLAAIVGDGRSTAAHTLKSQGLTFEHAIKFLRSSPTAATEVPVSIDGDQSTEDLLAEARSRIKTRVDSVETERADAPMEQQSAPLQTPPVSSPAPVVEVQETREPKPFGAPAPSQQSQLRKKAAVEPPTVVAPPPPPQLAPEPASPPPPVPATPPPVIAAPAPHPNQQLSPQPTAPAPLPHPAQQTPAGQNELPPLDDVFARGPSVAKPTLPSGTFESETQPSSQPPKAAPAGSPTRQPPPVGGMPPQGRSPQRPGPPVHAPGQLPPPQQAPSQQRPPPAPPIAGTLPPQSRPVAAGAPTQGREALQPQPGPGSSQLIEAGQLVENIPRTMKVGIAMLVEARIAKGGVRVITHGMQGNGQPQRHEVMITKAMSVRLRAPANGFIVETSSPETQWIENSLGALGDDFASWRWTITPKTSGVKQLQLIVSARTVGGDGLAAETVLPDQVIDVKVRTNYGNVAKRWGTWIVAAMVGGLFARFGEGFFDLATQLVDRLGSGGA